MTPRELIKELQNLNEDTLDLDILVISRAQFNNHSGFKLLSVLDRIHENRLYDNQLVLDTKEYK